jgi:hypothetical protein
MLLAHVLLAHGLLLCWAAAEREAVCRTVCSREEAEGCK